MNEIAMKMQVVKQYTVSLVGNVVVEIVETVDGRYRYVVQEPKLSEVAKKVHERVVQIIVGSVEYLHRISEFLSFDEALPFVRGLVESVARKYIRKGKLSEDDVNAIVYYVLRDFVGYGIIDPLLRDPHIEDITCDGVGIPIHVFHNEFEWLETNIVFPDVQSLERVVRKLAYRAGQEPTIAQPIVEGVLKPEGYRVHIVLDIVSRRGHTFTIRKFRAEPITITELIARKTLDAGTAALLWLAAENKQGIIVYGPTGAGKTTLLNAVAMLLPSEMKIVTAEDTPEIMLPFHDNWVAMVTRLSTDPKVQSVTLQAQVESAMRQRPDILILGEIRSREAYSFFQAVSTGHGGLTTIHAESVESLIRRLVAPPMSVPKALVSTSRLFVQILRLVLSGKVARRVTVIHEVDRYEPERDAIVIRTLVKWIREEDSWAIHLEKSSTLRAIADLLALDYNEVLKDLERRATILYWASKKRLDLISLHTLVRRYRRDPESVFREAVRELGEPYRIKVLEVEELKTV